MTKSRSFQSRYEVNVIVEMAQSIISGIVRGDYIHLTLSTLFAVPFFLANLDKVKQGCQGIGCSNQEYDKFLINILKGK